MVAVSVEHIDKQWGERYAVRDVSFAAEAGQFVVLLGPSGCGKTTTLRLLAGLDRPSAGRILIGGRDVTDLPPARRELAMVFQSYALFPHLTVADNILFGVRVRKENKTGFDARLRRVAELLNLGELLDRKPGQLSGGQQQRVALGRAIIAERPVCLMDEPLSNLDAQLRHEMRREIRALQQQLGITMIYVTHDQTEAMSMADKVILLRDGRIEQDASPDTLYAQPASAFAARFIGTPPMNVLPVAPDPRGVLRAGTQRFALVGGDNAITCIGVRPEHIRVDSTSDAAHTEDCGLDAQVTSSEYFGADTILACTHGTHLLAVRVPGKRAVSPGETVRLTWTADAQHWFDAHSGARLASREPLLASA